VTPTQRLQRITDIFQIASELPPEERERFVQRECRGDESLVREVQSRLAGAAESAAPVRRIGRYVVTGEIGSGGFGRVYRALDPTFGRVVAIKVSTAPGDANLVRRFRTEAETVANLHHRNIVTVYDFGEENGTPYLVMEYLNGTTLHSLIAAQSLTLLEKLEIMCEVAEGLRYAHEHGVTHRDIKPANIMRLADGSVKILDFGIAHLTAREASPRITRSGFVVGSLAYMAPEQFSGTSDALSDIFSFGVTFYETLTGCNPFAAPRHTEVIYRVTTVDPPPLRSLAPDCPEEVERILNGALARSRKVRWNNLADVVADTRAVLIDLRQAHADKLSAEAARLFDGGQLDAAKTTLRQVLELNPAHAAARALRVTVEEAVRARDFALRSALLMDKAENELADRRYPEAAETLAAVRQSSLSGPDLTFRLQSAEAQLEQGRRIEKLLASARDHLHGRKLTEAWHSVSEVLRADPANTSGQSLMLEIRKEMEALERRRKISEEIAQADRLLVAGQAEQAFALVAVLQGRYPDSPEVAAFGSRVQTQQVRLRRLADGIAEVKVLLKSLALDRANDKLDTLQAEWPDHPELVAMRQYAIECGRVSPRTASAVPQPLAPVPALPPAGVEIPSPEEAALLEAIEEDAACRQGAARPVPVEHLWPNLKPTLMQPVTWLAAAGTLIVLAGGILLITVREHRQRPAPATPPQQTVQAQPAPVIDSAASGGATLPPPTAPGAQPLPAAPRSHPQESAGAAATAPPGLSAPGLSPAKPSPFAAASAGTAAPSPAPAATSPTVPAPNAAPPAVTPPASGIAPPRVIASIADVQSIFIDNPDGELQRDVADEMRRQLGSRFHLASGASDADAVLHITLEDLQGGALSHAGRVLGVTNRSEVHAALTDPRSSRVLWKHDAGDRQPLAHGDAMKRMAERIVKQLRQEVR